MNPAKQQIWKKLDNIFTVKMNEKKNVICPKADGKLVVVETQKILAHRYLLQLLG